MKQMQRDPLATQKARKAERRADEKSGLITIKPVKLEAQSATATTAAGAGAGAVGAGVRKGGFRSAFGGVKEGEGGVADALPKVVVVGGGGFRKVGAGADGDEGLAVGSGEAGLDRGSGESETEDEGFEYYDPRRATGCWEGCAGWGS